jgi:hypothetical protein
VNTFSGHTRAVFLTAPEGCEHVFRAHEGCGQILTTLEECRQILTVPRAVNTFSRLTRVADRF